MAVFPNSAPAPKIHPLLLIKGKAGDFPASQAKRLALYAASTLHLSPSRQALEGLIDALIGCLDELDGCPDLEDGGDHEPWLGARELGAYSQSSWAHGADDGREWDDDGEPWLGSLERGRESSQIGCAFSASNDLESEVQA